MKGRVIALHEGFGFISNEAGVEYYFNEHSFIGRSEFSMLMCGSEVWFKPQKTSIGWRANYVGIKHKPPFEWEEGAIYVEAAPNRIIRWWRGCPPLLKTEHRILTSSEFVTGYFSTMEEAREFFYAQVRNAGANLIQDFDIETSVQLVLGHATTVYRYRAMIGIYLKSKKVKSVEEEAYLTTIFKEVINRRLESFMAFEAKVEGMELESKVA
jgi:cold shock CspA family protein